MAGTASAAHPDAFAGADRDEAAALVAAELAALAPDVVVTYEEHGGYGHPDHIQAHRVTMAAVASLDPERRPVVFGIVTPQSWAGEDRIWLVGHVDPTIEPPLRVPAAEDPWPPSVVPDEAVTHTVQAADLVGPQSAALAEHATQVRVFEGYYALSNDVAARLAGREAFVLLDPATGRPAPGAAGGATRHTGLLPGEGEP
jgi:N-acetyl-1-D-myo-inositol-2-amino-2-deoxy-alpha-D-glucopyranoside deacetylase